MLLLVTNMSFTFTITHLHGHAPKMDLCAQKFVYET